MKQIPSAHLERVWGGKAEKKAQLDDPNQPPNSIQMVERDLASHWLTMWPIRGRHVSFQFKDASGGGVDNVQLLQGEQNSHQGSAFITRGLMDPHQRTLATHSLSAGGFLEAKQCAQRVVERYNQNGPKPYSKLFGPSSAGFAQAVNDECHLGFDSQFKSPRDWQHTYWKRPGHSF